MSVLTITTLLVIVLSIFSRREYSWAIAIGGATPSGACLIAGSIIIPTFYGVGMGALAIVVANALIGSRRRASSVKWVPGLPLLVAFAAYAIAVTLLAPFLFDHLPIVTPVAKSLVAGQLTSSNLAQMVYVVIGIGVIAFLGRSRAADVTVLGLAVGLSIYLSAWRYIHLGFGVPFPDGVFDNSPSFIFIQTAPGGAERFRGIFSEPAALANSCLVAIVYFLVRIPAVSPLRRVGCLITVAIAAYLGIVSTSTTFIIGGIVVLAIGGAVTALAFFSRRYVVPSVSAVFACVLVIASLWLLPAVADFARSSILQKLGGDSYEERSGSDAGSYDVFLNSWGLGVGLGSGRGSSLLPTLLSTVGIVGALLLVGAIVLLIQRTGNAAEYRPVVWSLVTVLVVKLVSGADLADPSGLLWICLGLLARRAVAVERWPSLKGARSADPVAQERYSG